MKNQKVNKSDTRPEAFLVRLPNWLGDLVMSTAFLEVLRQSHPNARIDAIIRNELMDLAPFLPGLDRVYPFDKRADRGLMGLARFGRKIARQHTYDSFFCLPDSFSSAFMGYFAGASSRTGYAGEGRRWLLTHAVKRNRQLHRADTYLSLLAENNTFNTLPRLNVENIPPGQLKIDQPYIVLNINSEAQSRRIPAALAISLIAEAQRQMKMRIVLTGSRKEAAYVDSILGSLKEKEGLTNLAGQTSLAGLVSVILLSAGVISTDSGIAHVSNALGKKLVVLFGAGNESQTAPKNKSIVQIIRLGGLDCAPCVKNTCRFGEPVCLARLNAGEIIRSAVKLGMDSDEI